MISKRSRTLKQACGAVCLTGLLMMPVQGAAQGRDGAFDAATTNRVIESVAVVFQGCEGVDPVYLPDCVGKALQSGASKISNNPAYWEAHVALTRLSRGLTRSVRANRDQDASRLRAGGVRLDAVLASELPALSAETEGAIGRAIDDLDRLSASEVEAFAPLRDLLLNKRPWP